MKGYVLLALPKQSNLKMADYQTRRHSYLASVLIFFSLGLFCPVLGLLYPVLYRGASWYTNGTDVSCDWLQHDRISETMTRHVFLSYEIITWKDWENLSKLPNTYKTGRFPNNFERRNKKLTKPDISAMCHIWWREYLSQEILNFCLHMTKWCHQQREKKALIKN